MSLREIRWLSKTGLVIVTSATVFAAGVVAAGLFITPPVPPSLKAPSEVDSAPITERDFTDRRTVELAFAVKPNVQLTATEDGRVTSSTCTDGANLESGKPLLTLNDEPLLLLATSIPLWRDLSVGDKGDDVKALQTELARLGYDVKPDGVAGAATMSAVTSLFHSAGDRTATFSSLPVSRILWLGSPSVAVGSCDVALGAMVRAGDPIATLAGGLERASVAPLPDHLLPGDRVLKIDSVEVPIGQDGVLSDQASLAQVEATPTYLRTVGAKADEGATKTNGNQPASQSASAELELSQPIKIAVAPPAAVYSVKGSEGCVTSRGVAYPVTIVGSELGQSYIRFASTSTTARVDLDPRKPPRCP